MVARIASVVLRAAGGLAVVLGLLLWTGNGLGLTRVHMLLGLLVVLSLWVAGVGQALARAGGWPLAGGALLLGLLVLAVGMRQTSLLVGPSHWVVQAAHLLLGVLAIGVGQRCVARWQSGGAQAAEAARPRGAEGEAASRTSADAQRGRTMAAVSVRYIVRDVEESVAFYTAHLGFAVQMRPGPGFASLTRGDLRLLLSAAGGTGGGSQAMPDGRLPEPGGWNRIQLEVQDLPALVEQLRAQGARFRNEVVSGNGGRQILLEDPSGNPVELFEPHRA